MSYTAFQKSLISHLAETYIADMEATHEVVSDLHKRGVLDGLSDPRAIMEAAAGALTFVQSLRVSRVSRTYSSLCFWAERLGIEDVDAQCTWTEQRICDAGGARFVTVA